MAAKTSQHAEDLVTIYQTLFLDLPLAGARWGLGIKGAKETAEVAWKGYDAWVRFTSTSLDELYRNPLFAATVARSLDGWLRWRQLSNALAGAFFAGLWPAVGLPKTTEIQALHVEVRALREEVRSLTANLFPAQSKESKVHAELAEQLEAVPAQLNGNGTVNNMQAGLHKKPPGGDAAKERREKDAVTA
ncbi:MAG: hypothetical protein E6J80_12935 [Deltaproteobacteria bacterium]|nr:MAG: hypothetical protein E6J80_12935 [Deltaproteobacteria bacterium]